MTESPIEKQLNQIIRSFNSKVFQEGLCKLATQAADKLQKQKINTTLVNATGEIPPSFKLVIPFQNSGYVLVSIDTPPIPNQCQMFIRISVPTDSEFNPALFFSAFATQKYRELNLYLLYSCEEIVGENESDLNIHTYSLNYNPKSN
jgi:hypothetical protein